MNNSEIRPIDLSGLKDVHTGIEPPFFPPAIGWWIILACFILFILCLWGWYRFYYTSPKQCAYRILKKIEQANLPIISIGVATSQLLKRVTLVCFPREEVAELSGEKWANFLYTHGGGTLSPQQADFIAKSAYMPIQKDIAIDEKKFYTCVKKWINFVFRKGYHEH